ncbi:ATP-binding protein [Sulfurospirillum multivorans]|uniref:AAA family ATPASE n=2 Tax=Sulfurospirillum multivorans TaxID=66821 RepID=A0AA86AJ31_SULMK|nr:ATP-binding protein [Sulfurospirillum multivorans]AHJ11476.1 AAA family ATPASE [Sulfurospirillum multivorans DSM 12446]QEH04980.1 AAA family ATPASE [Sulfurospirillum multivorans]
MQYLIDFLESKTVQTSTIYEHLKCSIDEAKFLQLMTKEYVQGSVDLGVGEILIKLFGDKKYAHLQKLSLVKELIEQGWIVQNNFLTSKIMDVSNLELLNSSVTLSSAFLKLLEEGTLEVVLPDVTPYADHLEYLKDQFFRIELYQKLSQTKHNATENSPSIGRLKNKLDLLESRIVERIKVTQNEIIVETIFKENELSPKEQLIFLALLKEEYAGEFESLRDMNTLISLISVDDYEKIKNRSLLEEGSKLIENLIIDYDEMLSTFGGVTRSFFISEEILQKIMHPNKEKKSKKIKLDMLIGEQELFELIDPKTNLDDVILHPKTKEVLDNLLKQIDKNVVKLLREWGIKERRSGIDAKIILYGPPGTGKTMTALSLAKSMKKRVLSFDCSKILSKYVGESEKNVRSIFDTYKELCKKTKSEPLLLLNEADQFLSARSTDSGASADKMHNQMQNIFLEQIERFDGLLIATTNLLETIDPAFSRRFDYKIAFEKPDLKQRIALWKKLLPENATYEEGLDIEKLASYPLTGGQIKVVLKNTALKVAAKAKPLFTFEDFKLSIDRETKGAFGDAKSVGFMN